jgi:hypothetical protein
MSADGSGHKLLSYPLPDNLISLKSILALSLALVGLLLLDMTMFLSPCGARD